MRSVNLFGAAALLGVLLTSGCEKRGERKAPPPPRDVEVLTLAPIEVRETGEYLGSLLSRQTVNILPQIAGYVRKISVRPGQKVVQGETLIEVDARQEAAAVESAEAQVRSAQSTVELSQQTLARTESLYKEGLANAQELERARAALEAAQAASRSATAQAAQRKVQLQYFAVRAPFAGTVGDVLVRIGDLLAATTGVTSIAQADVLEVSVSIPPERARTVTFETPIELLDAAGKVILQSQVYFIAPQADPKTQLVEIKAAFRNTAKLLPSELVRARVVYATRRAISVPALAITRQSGQPFVYVVKKKEEGSIVTRVPVTLGSLGEQAYVIEKGLVEGDTVAVSSLQALRDGLPIRPQPAPRAAASAAESTTAPAPRAGGTP